MFQRCFSAVGRHGRKNKWSKPNCRCFIAFGRVGGKQKLSLSDGCVDHATVVHELTHLCPPLCSTFAVRETASLGQQMLNATVDINGLIEPPSPCKSFCTALLVLRGLRGALNGALLCGEAWASLSVEVNFFSLYLFIFVLIKEIYYMHTDIFF